MAVLNFEYYTENDYYSDGDIENKMLEMVREGKSYEDLPKEQVEFPLIYHFSDVRNNILCWYPIGKTESVLEIGAGCGAITGMLCEKANKVIAVELSKRRAEINFERNRNKDNLTIMVGNQNDMVFSERFDYVVLNGVLEYAMSFTVGEYPYETFLRNICEYLKPEGKVLIAIENRMGLKYFAGAPEDHTDLYFHGIDGYKNNYTVKTFSKEELSDLLKKSGLTYFKYYYPYPDYKFPSEIYTDDSLYEVGYGKSYPVYTDKNINFFSEKVGIDYLSKEKLLDRFVNSFLVVASRKQIEEAQKILYVKLNQERNKEFRLMTFILEKQGIRKVEKRAMNSNAVPTLKKIVEYGQQKSSGTYQNLPCVWENGAMTYPFLTGVTLHRKIEEWVEVKNVEMVKRALRDVYENLFRERKQVDTYRTEEFIQVFGDYPGKDYYECVKPANVDLICSNIIQMNNEYKIIDYEWVFPFYVPVSYIMWRMIHELYTKVPKLSPLFMEENMMEEFGIGYSDYEIFMHWSMHFVYKYVGSDSLAIYQKPRINLPLERFVEEENAKRYFDTKLYYDLGQGLNEENVVTKRVFLDRDRFEISIDLSNVQGIKGIRWNFAVSKCSEIKIDNIDCNCRIRLLSWDPRIENDDESTKFLTRGITYFIDAWDHSKIQGFTVQGRLRYIESEEIEQIIAEEYEKARRSKELKAKEKVEVDAAVIEPVVEKEQISVSVSKKDKIKRFIKKVLGKSELVTEVVPNIISEIPSTCIGNVDYYSYENGIINMVGWAFDTVHSMEKARIAFYYGEEKMAESSFSAIHREDVAQVLGIANANTSGFSLIAVVETHVPLEVYYEYDSEIGLGKFHIGSIPGNSSKNEVEIFPIVNSQSIGYIQYFAENHIIPGKITEPMQISPLTIDIIIPVYNGLKYFDTLFEGIERTKMNYRLILVDDKSPDPMVTKYLDSYAATHDNVILLRNEENMGFVRSVNRALEIAENHVALVNTDVEVPEEWLERLMDPIIKKPQIATTTPFTNCGTLCSFPEFAKDNNIFEDMPLWKIDDAFRKVKPQYPVMPTGVGFCMGMNIEAIRKVGVLDAETFGKGYGEENDWCQRAVKAGFTNVQVDNLFVYHKHGGSFPSEEKQKLLEHNLLELGKKHPNYNKEVAAFFRRDPAREIRLYAMMKLLNQKVDVPTIVAFDHKLGGGATEYLEEKKKLELKKGTRFLTIRYDVNDSKFWLNYEYKNYVIEFWTKKLEEVFQHILRVDEIWINELVTYPDLYQVLERIVELKRKHHAYLKMLLHDFFSMCPAINLMNAEGNYCNAAYEKECNACIPKNRSNAYLEYESGTIWRQNWEKFLSNCDEILAFSDDTAKLFKQVYPAVYRVKVIPHKPHYLLPLNKKAKITKTFNIGLLGVLCYKKGLEVVKKMVKYIEEQELNIKVKLIGVSDEEIDSDVFSCTGRYSKEQLPRLTMQEDIDMFMIPSIWPETFSYTTSEIISMNMPIAVFPIGAPVDRVKHYEKGLIISQTNPETIIKEMMDFAIETLGFDKMPVKEKKILFIGEEISFASRYRVEHFREQLFYQGFGSDFIQMDERDQIDMSMYSVLVFYRCSHLKGVEQLVFDAKKREIPVYYDIDDFIFNYDKISYLHFLKGSEYVDFKNTTEKIHSCMELCDGYFTSTNSLAEEIKKEFPQKPIVINRNCASMEMQILSHDALEQTDKKSDRIYIGYFSGSKTHDQDFEIVEQALEDIMNKYPNVYLKLVGVLSEDKMIRMKNRIEKLPFMEWQKLPYVIAGIHINLMPLEDSIFHCCKSENKWMEAALVKVPSVISRNKEMENVIENGETAWLCCSKDEWFRAIEQLVTDEKARKTMGEKAYKVVIDHYITQNTGKDAREELICRNNYSK